MSRVEFGDLCKGCLCAICAYRNHCEAQVSCDECKGKKLCIVSCSKFEQEATERDDLISRKALMEELQSLEISITGVHRRKKFQETVKKVMSSVLRIVEEQATVSDERIIILPKGIKPGDRVYEIYRFLYEGAWEISIHKLRFEDIPKMGKTVFPSIKQAENAIESAEKRGIKCEKELL